MSDKTPTGGTPKRLTINPSDNSAIVRLRGVRLSFPSIFKARAFRDDQDPKFSATFIMPKKGDPEKNLDYCQQALKEVIKMAFKGRHPGNDKVFLRDGATKATGEEDDAGNPVYVDGYGPDIMFVSSSNSKKIPVVDRDLTPLGEEDGKPYAGCYVNATIRIWAQDNKWGKRVNAQLRAVQFLKDGEAFGDSGANPEQEFEQVTGEETSDEDMLGG